MLTLPSKFTRRVIENLNHLGLNRSHQVIQRMQHTLHLEGESAVHTVGSMPTSIVTYNNFEFAQIKRGERPGDLRQFRSITNHGIGILRPANSDWKVASRHVGFSEAIESYHNCESVERGPNSC